MILFAVSNTEIIILVAIGLLLVALIGASLLRYTKVKMESELDEYVVKPINAEEQKLEGELLELNPIDELVINDSKENETNQDTKGHLSEIEILLEQMQSDLSRPDREVIHTFEEEQEEKSVISYQELKAIKESRIQDSEIEKYEQEQEEHSILNEELIPYYKEDPEEEIIPELKEYKEKPIFAHSDFISPVYGKMNSGEPDYPKIPNFKEEFRIDHNREEIMFDDIKVKLKDEAEPNLEHTFDLGPISEDVKKNDEFLKALKEFRNNLE